MMQPDPFCFARGVLRLHVVPLLRGGFWQCITQLVTLPTVRYQLQWHTVVWALLVRPACLQGRAAHLAPMLLCNGLDHAAAACSGTQRSGVSGHTGPPSRRQTSEQLSRRPTTDAFGSGAALSTPMAGGRHTARDLGAEAGPSPDRELQHMLLLECLSIAVGQLLLLPSPACGLREPNIDCWDTAAQKADIPNACCECPAMQL